LERMTASVHMGIDTATDEVYAYYEEHVRHLLEDDECPEWPTQSIYDHFSGGHGTTEVATLKRMNLMFLPKAMLVLQKHLVLTKKRNPKKQRLNIDAWKIYAKLSAHIERDFEEVGAS